MLENEGNISNLIPFFYLCSHVGNKYSIYDLLDFNRSRIIYNYLLSGGRWTI